MERLNEPIQEKDVIRDENGDEMENFGIDNADHPARIKAIEILESIADYMGDHSMFDCVEGTDDETRWYDLEDALTNIINR